MIRLLVIIPLLWLSAFAQDADFRRQVRSTQFTRELLEKTTAQQVRDLLNVTDIAGLAPIKDTLADLASHTGATHGQTFFVRRYSSTSENFTQPKAYTLNTNSTASTNAIVIENAGSEGGRWEHHWDGDVRAFGWSKSGTAAANGAAFRAAVAYADALTDGKIEVHVPSGTYRVDHLGTVVSSVIKGENWVDVGFDNAPTIIIQELGNTNDLLTISSTNTSKPTIENLWLYAAGESGRRNEKAITGVSSRTVFTVAVADLPSAPPSPSEWPYYGYCFFYSSEGRYMGCGIVQSVDTGTGQVTLLPNSDKYATSTAGAGLLTSSEKVIFSPLVTEAPVYIGTPITATGPDPTRVGPVGIRVFSKGYAHIKNVRVMNGHCGIAVGVANTGLQLENVMCEWSKFAGLANILPDRNSDMWVGRLRVGGFYIKEPDATTETISFNDRALRNTHTGIYLPSATSSFDDYLCYSVVHGIIGSKSYHVIGGLWVLDDIILDGISWFDGFTGSIARGTAFQIATALIRPAFQFPRPVYYTNFTAAVRFQGNQAVKGKIGQLSVERVNAAGGTNYFKWLYAGADTTNQFLSIAQHGEHNGILDWYDPNQNGRFWNDRIVLTGSNTLAAVRSGDVDVNMSNAGGWAWDYRRLSRPATGTSGQRWSFFFDKDLNSTRYSHSYFGDVTHTAPTFVGTNVATRFYTLQTDTNNFSAIVMGWGAQSDNTLNLRGNQVQVRVTSSTNTIATNLFINPGGGDVYIGGGTNILFLNTLFRILSDTNATFSINYGSTNLLTLSSSDWSTSGKTPWSMRYNGSAPQIGVTNINGAAVLYFIGVTPP